MKIFFTAVLAVAMLAGCEAYTYDPSAPYMPSISEDGPERILTYNDLVRYHQMSRGGRERARSMRALKQEKARRDGMLGVETIQFCIVLELTISEFVRQINKAEYERRPGEVDRYRNLIYEYDASWLDNKCDEIATKLASE